MQNNIVKRLISTAFIAFYFLSVFHFQLVHINNVEFYSSCETTFTEIDYLASGDPCAACLFSNKESKLKRQAAYILNFDNGELTFCYTEAIYTFFLTTSKKQRAPPLPLV